MPLSRRCKTFIIIAAVVAFVLATLFTLLYIFTRTPCKKDELFFEETKTCYQREQQGPCREAMVILEYSTLFTRRVYGGCSCPYTQHARTLLYHRDTKRCYFVFSQAFCESGFWLNVTKEGKPICEENRCITEFANSNETIEDEIVPLKGGQCAFLNHPAEGCNEDEVVRFYHDYILPSCKTPEKHKGMSGSVGIPRSACPIGSAMSIVGHCQPVFDFDF